MSNPLFVDSTKFRGEMIIADLEVHGIQLLEGETLYTKVILKDGRSYLVSLKPQANHYKGSIRLAYQEDVSFQHLIMKETHIVAQTKEEKLAVNYINKFTPKELAFHQRFPNPAPSAVIGSDKNPST